MSKVISLFPTFFYSLKMTFEIDYYYAFVWLLLCFCFLFNDCCSTWEWHFL